jgi:hypothetical protein
LVAFNSSRAIDDSVAPDVAVADVAVVDPGDFPKRKELVDEGGGS